jgi:hypothetical protein
VAEVVLTADDGVVKLNDKVGLPITASMFLVYLTIKSKLAPTPQGEQVGRVILCTTGVSVIDTVTAPVAS